VKRASRIERPAVRRASGFTLIDVLMVIVLLGVVAGALMTLSGRLATQSAETMRTRQALALAQALLDEVRHMPFTYCDPLDVNAANANAAAIGVGNCTSIVDGMGPEPGESRYAAYPNRYDGVTDYQGFVMPGAGCATLCDITGAPIGPAGSSLAGCDARVLSLTPQALPFIPALDVNGRPQVLLITVRVACPGMQPLQLEGIRVRHAPRWF
jgi:MSHA pilin protein MshD